MNSHTANATSLSLWLYFFAIKNISCEICVLLYSFIQIHLLCFSLNHVAFASMTVYFPGIIWWNYASWFIGTQQFGLSVTELPFFLPSPPFITSALVRSCDINHGLLKQPLWNHCLITLVYKPQFDNSSGFEWQTKPVLTFQDMKHHHFQSQYIRNAESLSRSSFYD